MAVSTATITFDLADWLGDDLDARRVRAYITTNIASGFAVDTSGNKIRLADAKVIIAADGTGSATVWVPGVDTNPSTWQTTFNFDVPRVGRRDRTTLVLGPFTITENADLAGLVEEQYAPPEWQTAFTTAMDALADAAQDSADDAADSATEANAAKVAAETARDQAEAIALGDVIDQITAAIAAVTFTTVTDTYTLALSDAGKLIKANKATGFTITIPPESSVAWPDGTVISGLQLGAGQVTIAAGSGVTLRAPSGAKTAAQYGRFDLIRLDDDDWLLDGALNP